MTRGRLLVLEGGEGVGKTTQWHALAARLAADGREVVALREPGGTPIGDAVRAVLLERADAPAPLTEALLFAASRAELIAREIRPALARGATVLLDRYLLSSYVYQGIVRGVPLADVRAMNAIATGGLAPDLTLLLTLPVAEQQARRAARSVADRMERETDAFHERVAAAFADAATPAWQAAHPECGPIVAVDASGMPDTVMTRLLATVAERAAEPAPPFRRTDRS